jgi:uncharacterized membrane-anchored protein YhcB (DUF1043 family)
MTGVVMIVLIFLVGSLFGLLLGALVCIRFVRQEVTGDLRPKLNQIQGQLNTIEAELTYAVGSRYAELNARLTQDPRQ